MPTDDLDNERIRNTPGMNQKVGAPPKGAAVSALGDQITAEDFQMAQMLQRLQSEMSGAEINPDGSRYTRAQIIDAEMRYMQLREFADMQRAQREAEAQQARDRELVAEQNRITQAEIAGKLELEQQRIDLEQQRIEIEKAKVVVDAMARIGADPEMRKQFGPMLEAMGQRLLAGTAIGVSDADATKLRLISTAAKPNGSGGGQ